MAIFTERERNILKKFKNGALVETLEEQEIIDQCTIIGYVSTGYDWDKMMETAKLTEQGLIHLNR